MSNCYCANYYGSIHCHNVVARFGDRCKLCVLLKSGASLSDGLLPPDELWLPSPQVLNSGASSSEDLLPQDELWLPSPRPTPASTDSMDSSDSSGSTTGRTSRPSKH